MSQLDKVEANKFTIVTNRFCYLIVREKSSSPFFRLLFIKVSIIFSSTSRI